MHKIEKIERKIGVGNGTFFYMFSSLFIKFVGALYKIPLFNMLSLDGVGLYQMIFPLFSFLIILCGGYLPQLMTKLIGEGGDKNKLLSYFVKIFLFVSFVVSFMLFIFARQIAKFQGNGNGEILYKVIAFAIIPITIIGCLRGYFQGISKFKPTAISQIIEQVVKVVLSLTFIKLSSGSYLEKVAIACFAIVISEIFALLYLVILYFLSNLKEKRKIIKDITHLITINPSINTLLNENKVLNFHCQNNSERDFKLSKKTIFKEMMPLFVFSLMMPLSSVIDSFIVINLLKINFGSLSTSIYGLYTGIVQVVIMLPVGFLHGLSSGFLPELSKNRQKNVTKKLFFIVFVSSTFFVFLIAISRGLIIKILYRSHMADLKMLKRLLLSSSSIVVFLSLLQTTNIILLSKGKQLFSVFSIFSGVVFKIISNLTLVKIPEINIFGMVISNVGCYFVALIINLVYIYYSNKQKKEENSNENHTCSAGNRIRYCNGRGSKGYKFM